VSTVTLSNADNARSIRVRTSDEIVVQLPENPTTGYRWFVERIDGPVTLESDSYTAVPPVAIGSGGMRELRFHATVSGAARLELKHWQEWEGDSSVTERFAVDIEVTG
jgi:inhibitor of cysteine peptidase